MEWKRSQQWPPQVAPGELCDPQHSTFSAAESGAGGLSRRSSAAPQPQQQGQGQGQGQGQQPSAAWAPNSSAAAPQQDWGGSWAPCVSAAPAYTPPAAPAPAPADPAAGVQTLPMAPRAPQSGVDPELSRLEHALSALLGEVGGLASAPAPAAEHEAQGWPPVAPASSPSAGRRVAAEARRGQSQVSLGGSPGGLYAHQRAPPPPRPQPCSALRGPPEPVPSHRLYDLHGGFPGAPAIRAPPPAPAEPAGEWPPPPRGRTQADLAQLQLGPPAELGPCASPAAALALLGDATQPLDRARLAAVAAQAARLAAEPAAPPTVVDVPVAVPAEQSASRRPPLRHAHPADAAYLAQAQERHGFLLRDLATIDAASAAQWSRVADALRRPEELPREELVRQLCRALEAHVERGNAIVRESAASGAEEGQLRGSEQSAAQRWQADPRRRAAETLASAPVAAPRRWDAARGPGSGKRAGPALFERRKGELPSGRSELAPVPQGYYGAPDLGRSSPWAQPARSPWA